MSTLQQHIVSKGIHALSWASLGLGCFLVILASATLPRIHSMTVGEGLLGTWLAWSLFGTAKKLRKRPVDDQDQWFVAILVITVVWGSLTWLISLIS